MRFASLLCLLTTPMLAFAEPTAFQPLLSEDPCNKCAGYALPGERIPSHETKWTIHSDLPETFTSEGVLYATTPVLPPFNALSGDPISEEMRTQVNRGFKTIDDDFEVFFFHTTNPPSTNPGRRVVVYVRNAGDAPVTIDPRQAVTTEGLIGTVHEMENNLAKKVMAGNWDEPHAPVTLQPGEGAVVASSTIFAAPRQTPEASRNRNAFGVVQAQVEPAGKADVEVFVVGLPAGPAETMKQDAEKLLGIGANSGEAVIDMTSEPSGCQVRRSTGVFESFSWKSAPVVVDLDVATSPSLRFPMAVPEVQSQGCPEIQQTAPLVLHSRASRPDTVGNYMNEYLLSFEFINTGTEPKSPDLRFGKEDADIGLAWQYAVGPKPATPEELRALPVHAAWAGPKQTADLEDNTRSMFINGRPVVAPGASVHVGVRFMIVGNASLPFHLHAASE